MHLKLKHFIICAIILVCIFVLVYFAYKLHLHYRLNLTSVYVNKYGNIVLNGPLNADLLSKFNALENELDFENRLMIVRSTGGSLVVGMAIGRVIHKYRMNVEVNEFCASACANYIFTAANIKYVSHDSGLIFHGDARQANLGEKLQEAELWGHYVH